jgi:hypothetical protein
MFEVAVVVETVRHSDLAPGLGSDGVKLVSGWGDSFLATPFAEMSRMALATTLTLTFRSAKRFVLGLV